MSKEKQFEHIENKIREAVSNQTPEFDEKAWQKMEALLDKDDRKKRPFLWWFLGLFFIVAGGWLLFFTPTTNKHSKLPSITQIDKHAKQHAATLPIAPSILAVTSLPDSNVKHTINHSPVFLSSAKHAKKGIINKNDSGKNAGYNKTVITKKIAGSYTASIENADASEDNANEKLVVANQSTQLSETQQVVQQKNANQSTTGQPATIDSIATLQTQTVDKKVNSTDTTVSPSKKDKQQKVSGFYVVIMGGIDAASVRLLNFGKSKFTPKYGVAAGYQFNKKWALQAGFFISNKKYTAGPGDYNLKPGSYLNYVDLKAVKAVCKVYEIPVALRYNFLTGHNKSWYLIASASSYIMKKEDYNYYYTRYGQAGEKYYSYTGNQHLFSTLSLAAGFEQKITSRLFIQAEPSVSIPLKGVGDGKVNLYAAALAVGLRYKLF